MDHVVLLGCGNVMLLGLFLGRLLGLLHRLVNLRSHLLGVTHLRGIHDRHGLLRDVQHLVRLLLLGRVLLGVELRLGERRSLRVLLLDLVFRLVHLKKRL